MPAGGEDRAREFYAGILGLSEVAKPATMAANGGAWFKTGDVELHLGVDHDFKPAKKAHPAMLVRDLDKLASLCQAYGAEVEWDDRYPGVRRFYVHDPFGNRLELMQASADSQPSASELALLKEFLGNLAYRTREALHGASPDFGAFDAGHGSPTPERLLRHMRGVIGAARVRFVGESYVAEPLATLVEEAAALRDAIIDLAAQAERGPWDSVNSPTRLLPGPLAEAMTLVGQLELLRRLTGDTDSVPRADRITTPVLPDVLTPGLAVVFCGTAAGNESARRRAYYAGPGNAFWPTLFKVGLTPRQFAPEEFRSVLDHGLGLTDLAKLASGPDAGLSSADFDRDELRTKVLQYAPRVLAFTSKKAAMTFLDVKPIPYGLLDETIGETRLFVLPSPSGAARGHWNARHWADLAKLAHDYLT